MINSKELLFVVDEENNPIEPKPRDETHSKNYWHRTAHIWIINKNGEILCQQRSLLKDKHPGFWEPFFGGHLSPNEEYDTGAVKELYEELGIQNTKDTLQYFDIVKSEKSYEFQGIFLYTFNNEKLTLEKDEVSQIKWYKLYEIKQIVQNKNGTWVLPAYSSAFLTWLEVQTKNI